MPLLRPAALALVLALAAPAVARAAATLRGETLPGGVTTAADREDVRTAVIDAAGNLLVDLDTTNKGRWAVRPAGGPLGAPQGFPQPSIIGDWPAPATMSLDAAGDALAYAGAFWTYRPAGAGTAWGPVTTATGNDRLIDVAMAPTGEALGVFKNGATLKVAFRPAGAAAQFDLAGATVFTPSPGDTSTTPVGLAIDPDGGADLLYRSEHTGSRIYLESRRPAGGAFQAPVQYDWPQAASFRFSRAADGTAAISGWTGYATAFAAVRPPGGTFAARQTIETAPPGGELGLYQPVVAVSGGRALTAVTHSEPSTMCAGGAGGTSGWTLHRYDPQLGWSTAGSGPDTWPQISNVAGMAAAGATVAFVTEEDSGTGSRCDGTYQRALTLHAGTADAQQAFTIGGSEGDAQRVPTMTFVAAGPAGAAAAGVTFSGGASPDPLEHLAVYEDASAPAPGGGGGGGAGGGGGTPGGGGSDTPGGGGSAGTGGGGAGAATTPGPGAATTPPGVAKRPTAPPAVTLTGPIGIRENVAPVPFSCPADAPGTCLLAITLLGVRPHAAAAAAAAKTITLGRASAAVKAGARRTVAVKLGRAGRSFVKPHRTTRATLRVVVTIAGAKTTITRSVKLKRP